MDEIKSIADGIAKMGDVATAMTIYNVHGYTDNYLGQLFVAAGMAHGELPKRRYVQRERAAMIREAAQNEMDRRRTKAS